MAGLTNQDPVWDSWAGAPLDGTPGGHTILPQPRSHQIENGITVVEPGMFVLNSSDSYVTEGHSEGTLSIAGSAVMSGSLAGSLSSMEDEAHLGVAPATGRSSFLTFNCRAHCSF